MKRFLHELRLSLYTRKCRRGEHDGQSSHTAHLTALGRRHYATAGRTS